jgi:hypothetical protein
MPNFIDLTGKRFGMLQAIELHDAPGSRKALRWRCLCDCGATVLIGGDSLRTGNSQSCGCVRKQRFANMITKHGGHGTPEYIAWQGMLDRCHNPKNKRYHRYGMRGIGVCDRWRHSFDNFLADMGKKPSAFHSIDRVENDGNYHPNNCRWATKSEQANNTSTNRVLDICGQKLSVSDAARAMGVDRNSLWKKVRRRGPPGLKFDSREAFDAFYKNIRGNGQEAA